ncbi:MAG: type II toxin-antitoxin system VapC family toxin [Myxococcota bacterium]
MIVPDASVVVAALLDSGPAGSWAEKVLEDESLSAPHLLPAEVSNIIRRLNRAGDITPETADAVHDDLIALDIELAPFRPLANRIWELRTNVTSYDAWYVALAESLNVRLVTLDEKLARATGIRCDVVTPSP